MLVLPIILFLVSELCVSYQIYLAWGFVKLCQSVRVIKISQWLLVVKKTAKDYSKIDLDSLGCSQRDHVASMPCFHQIINTYLHQHRIDHDSTSESSSIWFWPQMFLEYELQENSAACATIHNATWLVVHISKYTSVPIPSTASGGQVWTTY